MCQSENFWHIVVGILRRISPFQRSAALGGPFFVHYFFAWDAPVLGAYYILFRRLSQHLLGGVLGLWKIVQPSSSCLALDALPGSTGFGCSCSTCGILE